MRLWSRLSVAIGRAFLEGCGEFSRNSNWTNATNGFKSNPLKSFEQMPSVHMIWISFAGKHAECLPFVLIVTFWLVTLLCKRNGTFRRWIIKCFPSSISCIGIACNLHESDQWRSSMPPICHSISNGTKKTQAEHNRRNQHELCVTIAHRRAKYCYAVGMASYAVTSIPTIYSIQKRFHVLWCFQGLHWIICNKEKC